jgi:hypothetical protein
MWFWNILSPKQNKFLDNNLNASKFLLEVDGSLQPVKQLKINLKNQKNNRLWSLSWNSFNRENNTKYDVIFNVKTLKLVSVHDVMISY